MSKKNFTCSLWKQETFSKEDDYGTYMTAGISILSLLQTLELCLLSRRTWQQKEKGGVPFQECYAFDMLQ